MLNKKSEKLSDSFVIHADIKPDPQSLSKIIIFLQFDSVSNLYLNTRAKLIAWFQQIHLPFTLSDTRLRPEHVCCADA